MKRFFKIITLVFLSLTAFSQENLNVDRPKKETKQKYSTEKSITKKSTVKKSSKKRSYKAKTSGTVRVKGYYRKDGTYVRPHTRRTPRRR